MNKIAIVLFLVFVSSVSALTPQERKIVLHMQSQLDAGRKKYAEEQSKIVLADQRAADAETHAAASDQHANDTDINNQKLSQEIDVAHKREQTNANLVAKYKPFWDTGHKWWGIGAIIAGIGILAGHLLVMALAVVVLIVSIWLLSFIPWLSWIRPVGSMISNMTKLALSKLLALLHKS